LLRKTSATAGDAMNILSVSVLVARHDFELLAYLDDGDHTSLTRVAAPVRSPSRLSRIAISLGSRYWLITNR
jgi:hypothetical protein